MLKYVLNHKKVIGSLEELCDKVFKDQIYFLRDSGKKPEEYLYVKRSDVEKGNIEISTREISCLDQEGKLVKVSLEEIK